MAFILDGELNDPRALMYLTSCVSVYNQNQFSVIKFDNLLHSCAAEGGAVGKVEAFNVLLHGGDLMQGDGGDGAKWCAAIAND